jgi:hypothetical protein
LSGALAGCFPARLVWAKISILLLGYLHLHPSTAHPSARPTVPGLRRMPRPAVSMIQLQMSLH